MFQTADIESIPSSLDERIVLQEITRIARAALREAAESDARPARLRARVRVDSKSGDAWDLRAQSLLQAGHGQPVVVVALERVAAGAADVDDIRDRFGLSPRQAQVAVMLGQRLSTKEIATRLGVAYNTARRHVELVLLRLRVHSRSEVADLLGGAAPDRPAAVVGH